MGLAGATAEALKQRGFVIGTTATVDAYDGVARISFGKNGVAQAYTLLAQFDGATMLALGVDDATVNVALGAQVRLAQADRRRRARPGGAARRARRAARPYEQFASTGQTPAPTPAG